MKSINELNEIREEAAKKINCRLEKHHMSHIVVSMGTCGIESGARPVLLELVEEVSRRDLRNVIVMQSGCIGECEYEPVVVVKSPDGHDTVYGNVKVEDVKRIIDSVVEGNIVSDILLENLKK